MKPLLILFGLGAAAAWLLASDKAEAKPGDKPADKAAPTGAQPPPIDLLSLYAVDTAAQSPAFAEFAKAQPVVAGAVAEVAQNAGLPVMWMLAPMSDEACKAACTAMAKAAGVNPDVYFADRGAIAPIVAAAAAAVQKCLASCGHAPGSAECRTACVAAIGPAIIAACNAALK